jgi:hypothetical protein
MSKSSTKPGDDTDTGNGSPPPTAPATVVEPSAPAIRAATASDDDTPEAPTPTVDAIPTLLERVAEIDARLRALLDDLAVAIPDLHAPAPLPSASPSPSGVYAPSPLGSSLDAERERAAAGDRAALFRYLRLRRS